MMAQYPFTDDGVTAKLEELYALSDAALLVQCKAMVADFKGWVQTNFILDDTQNQFLSSMTDRGTFSLSAQLAATINGRGAVGVGPIPPNSEKRPKQVFTTGNGGITFRQDLLEFASSMTMEMNWELL